MDRGIIFYRGRKFFPGGFRSGGLVETNGYANSFPLMAERIPLLKASDVSLQVLARATSEESNTFQIKSIPSNVPLE